MDPEFASREITDFFLRGTVGLIALLRGARACIIVCFFVFDVSEFDASRRAK